MTSSQKTRGDSGTHASRNAFSNFLCSNRVVSDISHGNSGHSLVKSLPALHIQSVNTNFNNRPKAYLMVHMHYNFRFNTVNSRRDVGQKVSACKIFNKRLILDTLTDTITLINNSFQSM